MYQLFALCLVCWGKAALSWTQLSQGAAGRKREESLQVRHSPFSHPQGMYGQVQCLLGQGSAPLFVQQSSWRAQAQQLWSPGQGSKLGLLQPVCPGDFTGDKTLSKLIKVNHD